FQVRGYVDGKGIVSALMRTGLLTIYIYLALPVDRPEVQQHTLFTDGLVDRNHLPVPEGAILTHSLSDTRERRLHRIRYQEFTFVLLRHDLQPARHDGIVPQTVQVLPTFTDQLRPWIFGQWMYCIDIAGPGRHDFAAYWLP